MLDFLHLDGRETTDTVSTVGFSILANFMVLISFSYCHQGAVADYLPWALSFTTHQGGEGGSQPRVSLGIVNSAQTYFMSSMLNENTLTPRAHAQQGVKGCSLLSELVLASDSEGPTVFQYNVYSVFPNTTE